MKKKKGFDQMVEGVHVNPADFKWECPKCKQSNISFASDFSFTTCPCGQSIMIRIRRDA